MTMRPTALMGFAINSLNLNVVMRLLAGVDFLPFAGVSKNIDFFLQSQVFVAFFE
jgi:hypothetical protein